MELNDTLANMEKLRNMENQTIRTLFNRRSMRAFTKEKISKEHQNIIIQAAMRAPTAGNMMMYSILEIEDQTLKDKLAISCDNQPMIAKAPFVLIFLSDLQRWYDFFNASGVQKFCQEKNHAYRTPQESDLMLGSCDALIAAQNAVIAAEALGIGSCYIGDIMENCEQHQEMLNLPRWVFPITMVIFGFPKNPAPRAKLIPRMEQKFVHHVDTYRTLPKPELDDAFSYMLPPSMRGKAPEEMEFQGDATNIGQAVYLRKTGSDYAQEMVRSVKKMVDRWKNG